MTSFGWCQTLPIEAVQEVGAVRVAHTLQASAIQHFKTARQPREAVHDGCAEKVAHALLDRQQQQHVQEGSCERQRV
jgi:hypothetical protein